MRLMKWAIAPMAAAALVMAPVAHADYSADVVGQFGPATHVYVDPGAHPMLQNSGAINNQVLDADKALAPQFDAKATATGIYIANVAPNRGVTYDSLQQALSARYGSFSGIVLVIDSSGYHVRAFNVSQALADNTEAVFAEARNGHRGDLNGTVSSFVDQVAQVRPGQPHAAPAAAGPAKPMDWTWAWVLLWIAGGGTAIGLLVWGLAGLNRRRAERAEQRDSLKSELVAADSDVNDLASAVVTDVGADVSAESLAASNALSCARKAFKDKDYVTAQAHLEAVRRHVNKADRKRNPNTEAVEAVPKRKRKYATVQVKNPTTDRVVTVDNGDYRRNRTAGYHYYYGGGMYNGMFFYPGYYPYPFYTWAWSPSEVSVGSSPLFDYNSVGTDTPFTDDLYQPSYVEPGPAEPTHHASSAGSSYGYDRDDEDSSSHHYSSSSSSSSSSDSSSSSYDSGGSSFGFGGGFDSGFSGGGSDSSGGSFGF